MDEVVMPRNERARRFPPWCPPAAAFLFLALAGCAATPRETQRPAAPPLRSGNRPEPPPAPNPPPPQQSTEPPAQDASRDRARRTARLIQDLDNADSNRAYFAVVALLTDWTHDSSDRAGLDAIATRLRGSRPEQQRTLVKAVSQFTTLPGPSDAERHRAAHELVPLLAPFLGNQDANLRKEAIDALASIDAQWMDEHGHDEIEPLIKRNLDLARIPPPTSLEMQSAIRLIGRKPAKVAVPRLIEAAERFPSPIDVRAAAFDELHAVTGQDFRRNVTAAKEWWDRNRDRRPDEWYRERIVKTEEETTRARKAARDYWALYAKSLANDPALVPMLRDSLSAEKTEIPQVRADAARQLAEVGSLDAFNALVDALATERDLDVVRQILDQIAYMARTPPDEPPEARVRASRAILPRTAEIEKDVRVAAINALAYLACDESVPTLIERLQAKDRDAEVAIAALQGLSRIGARTQPRVVAEIDRFLQREWKRDARDPQRDPRLFKECANALGNLAERHEVPAASPDARVARELLAQLLECDPAGGAVAAGTRQFAAFALGKLGMRESLLPLYRRLDEKVEPDEGVTQYAAKAIGEIASGDLPAADRDRATAALILALKTRPEPEVKEATFEAVRAILKAEPLSLGAMSYLADQLAAANDHARLVRLLKSCLPEKAPPGGEEVFGVLREKLANALALTGKWEEADRTYAEILKGAPAPADPMRIWAGRLALVRRLVVDAKDPAQASVIANRMLQGTGPLAPPADYAAALKRLVADTPGQTPVNAPPEKHDARPSAALPGGYQEAGPAPPPGGGRR
jgi:HEAT repeat protein